MRFLDILIICIFSGFLITTASACVKASYKQELLVREKEKALDSKVFIAESFKNCCKGKGFKNLTQWQLCCRALWRLDYIGWCDSEEFMVDESAEKSRLLYGKWTGENSNGEVYCRLKKEGK